MGKLRLIGLVIRIRGDDLNKQQLIDKYAKKCDDATEKYDKARRDKIRNRKTGNVSEAHYDELEQESYATEFRLSEQILSDLKQLKI